MINIYIYIHVHFYIMKSVLIKLKKCFKKKDEKTKTVYPQKLLRPTKAQGTHNMRNFLNTKLMRPSFSRKLTIHLYNN